MRAQDSRHRPASGDQGSALIIALVATVLLTSLGLGLVVLSNTETAIAGNFRVGHEALYAADAAVERAVQDLPLVADWTDVLTGAATSSFIDTTLTPIAPYGGALDLTALTAELQTWTDTTAPWGANNPHWTLFLYGPLSSLVPAGGLQSLSYIVVWMSDDPSETDGNPAKDANGVLSLIAKGLGPNGAGRAIEVTLERVQTTEVEPDPAAGTDAGEPEDSISDAGHVGVRILSWRDIR
jgi:Tfp pilus assembly protein PilX